MNTRIEELEKHLEALTRMQLTTRREINNFKEELQQLKQEEQAWPKQNKSYWYIGADGEVYRDFYTNQPKHERRKAFGNIFRTKEEAERHALRSRIYNRLWAMADGGKWLINSKSAIEYFGKPLLTTPTYSTKGKTQAALDAVSDDLKKLQEMSDE